MMKDVPKAAFAEAQVREVCGFVFRYDPNDPDYGVGVVTDGTIPPLSNLEAALDVGRRLQAVLFRGQAPRPKGRIFW